jgi:uncharacterized protein YbaR (Trm112 family)
MALDPILLEILVCPDTKQSVRPLSAEALATLNRLIREAKVKNRAGVVVNECVDAGLLREDKSVVYPVRQDIPIMLTEEALSVVDLALPV